MCLNKHTHQPPPLPEFHDHRTLYHWKCDLYQFKIILLWPSYIRPYVSDTNIQHLNNIFFIISFHFLVLGGKYNYIYTSRLKSLKMALDTETAATTIKKIKILEELNNKSIQFDF